MPRGMHKSRTFRRVSLRTPGGRNVMHYAKRKPGKAKCAVCKTELKGIKADIPSKIKKLSKSQKTVARPYSNLCSACMRRLIKEKIRG